MPFTTSVAGTVITAAWANANVRDQAVTPFASTSARDSAITSPVVGMVCYVSSNNASEGFYTYTSAAGWVKGVWNEPWGYLGTIYTPSNFTFNTSAQNSASMAPTLVQNRRYAVAGFLEVQNGSATGTVNTVTLYNVTAATSLTTLAVTTPSGANGQDGRSVFGRFTAASSGTFNLAVRAVSSLSASTQTIANISLEFIDLGPAGAPV